MRTGPTNPKTQELVSLLRKQSSIGKCNLWKTVAEDLEKPTRERRVVNLSKLARYTKPNEIVVVPGKVLGSGVLPHSVIVGALAFSESAKDGITKAKGKAITIQELMKKDPKEIRVIG